MYIYLHVVICIVYTSRSIMLIYVGVVLYIGLAYAALAGSLPAQPEVCRVCVANLRIPRSIACTYTRSSNLHSRKERDIHTHTCLQINGHTSTQYIHNLKAPCNMIYMHIHAHATYCIECSYASFTRRARTDSRCGQSGTPRNLFYMYTYRGRCRSCRESSTWRHQGREVCVCV